MNNSKRHQFSVWNQGCCYQWNTHVTLYVGFTISSTFYIQNFVINQISILCGISKGLGKILKKKYILNLFIKGICLSGDTQSGNTKSQNHGMVEIGKGLQRSACLTLLLEQGHLQPVPQDHDQMAFEYLPRRETE